MGTTKKLLYLLCLIALYSTCLVLDHAGAQTTAKSQIAFISNAVGEPQAHIYVMDEDGQNIRRLTFGDDGCPSWSPDGNNIAFVRFVVGGNMVDDICVVDANGHNVRRIVRPNTPEVSPSWSPDGRKIAYISGQGRWDIYVMDVDGRNVRKLTDDGEINSCPAWSPDGRRIAFVSDRDGKDGKRDIYVMDANGKNVQRITNWNNGFPSNPAWSPGGWKIAFDAVSDNHGTDIYVINADGTNMRRLTDHRGYDSHPAWLDDRRIVFVSGRDGNSEIYVVDIDGSNLRNLTNNPARDEHPACWPGYLSGWAVPSADRLFSTWGWIKHWIKQ